MGQGGERFQAELTGLRFVTEVHPLRQQGPWPLAFKRVLDDEFSIRDRHGLAQHRQAEAGFAGPDEVAGIPLTVRAASHEEPGTVQRDTFDRDLAGQQGEDSDLGEEPVSRQKRSLAVALLDGHPFQ